MSVRNIQRYKAWRLLAGIGLLGWFAFVSFKYCVDAFDCVDYLRCRFNINGLSMRDYDNILQDSPAPIFASTPFYWVILLLWFSAVVWSFHLLSLSVSVGNYWRRLVILSASLLLWSVLLASTYPLSGVLPEVCSRLILIALGALIIFSCLCIESLKLSFHSKSTTFSADQNSD